MLYDYCESPPSVSFQGMNYTLTCVHMHSVSEHTVSRHTCVPDALLGLWFLYSVIHRSSIVSLITVRSCRQSLDIGNRIPRFSALRAVIPSRPVVDSVRYPVVTVRVLFVFSAAYHSSPTGVHAVELHPAIVFEPRRSVHVMRISQRRVVPCLYFAPREDL